MSTEHLKDLKLACIKNGNVEMQMRIFRVIEKMETKNSIEVELLHKILKEILEVK